MKPIVLVLSRLITFISTSDHFFATLKAFLARKIFSSSDKTSVCNLTNNNNLSAIKVVDHGNRAQL